MSEFTESQILNLSTDENLDKFLESDTPCILFFWAEWHNPSKSGGQMDQFYKTLLAKYGNSVNFGRIEAEKFPSASLKFEIRVVPTFITIFRKKTIGKVEGANPTEINKLLEELESSSIHTTEIPKTVNHDERLRELVKSSPVMLFMKGNPETPRCGFSRKIVDILKVNKIQFASFDILSDNEVREGLKKLFEWPTYPQLYVRGELAGGLDIIEEMAKGGDLATQLGIIQEMNAPKPTSITSLNERLRSLINKAPVMLFMKGTSDTPRCGFSKSMVEILADESITFEYFDILSDDEVREGIKIFSNWPTYPQLYVKGELIGGLDIIKEMRSGGTLKEQLNL